MAKEFDMEPIDSRPSLSFKGRAFRKREIVVGVLLVVCLVVIVVLAALLASASSSSDGTPCVGGPDSQKGSNTSESNVCLDYSCLGAAAHVLSLLDKSASPCDDFYNYACGKFPQMNPLDVNTQELTTVSIIFRKNEERFRRLLDKPPISNAVNSYDRKAKVFFSSCQDHFYRTQLGGKPLLDHVIGELPGGWWALGRDEDWDDDAWDLTSVLRKTHVDFWTSTFFSFLLQADQLDLTKPAIQIDIWGTAMPHYVYLSPFYAKYIDDYKTFIRTVGSLLLRDASPNATDEENTSRVEQFVNDAFEVESKIVDVKASSMRHPNPFASEERMTLQQLSDQTSGAVDFVSLLTYMYNEAAVDGSTPVVVPEKAYLLNLTNWIKDEMAADAKTIKRKLNNYIVWRLAHRYAQDLSWEYTTAGQQFEMDILGAKLFPSTWWYCVTKLEVFMHEAMGAMLVREHFGEANKRKAHEITDHVKTALMESLSSTLHWMSVESRNKAEQKLRDSIMKIGYPDYMMREDTLNMKFATFTVNPDTYFQNLLSSNKVLQKYINEQFTNFGKKSSVWGIPVQSQRALYYNPWKELIVPAGLLQFPIYDHTSPNYMNFGSMGAIVGTALVHAVDAEGSMFHLDGSQMGTSWWSNHTQQEYQRVRQCMVDAYSDAVQGPFGQGPLSSKIKVDMMYYTPQAFRDSSGVKLAYKAYKDWMAETGGEKRMPGAAWTNEQSFFVAFAQSLCFTRKPEFALYQAQLPWQFPPQENVRVNRALAQLKEFQEAFQCDSGAKMVAPSRCQLY